MESLPFFDLIINSGPVVKGVLSPARRRLGRFLGDCV